MAELEKPFDIHEYIHIGFRQKWLIVAPLVICVVAAYGAYRYLPKIYRATTMILVQPQRVPEEYVRSTVTDSVAGRLNTISQEILSRTRLERVIQELNLYGDLRQKVPMEAVVDTMRKAIEVKVQTGSQYERSQNSFSVSYEGREPRTVMLVTNKLASLFIEENLRVRELRAEGTSEFLSKELAAMEDKLKKKEHDIRVFKERSMGQLPQQLDANLKIMERLQDQLKTTSENIRAVEDRIVLTQTQIEQIKDRERSLLTRESRRASFSSSGDTLGTGQDQGSEDPLVTQLNSLKRDLTGAQAKYTESHPDVIDLKRKIASLEPKVKEVLDKQKAAQEARLRELRERRDRGDTETQPIVTNDPVIDRLLAQYTDQHNEAKLEVKRLRGEEKNLRDQIVLYRKRIEDTPQREQELALLTRDYELMKTSYQSLLDKKIQAQMAENLERKQQGEQFKVLDPARIPEKPVKPDRNKILLMGAMVGLVIGFGLAWFRESLDQSFHTVTDVEAYLDIPVIATIPNLIDEGKLHRKTRKAA